MEFAIVSVLALANVILTRFGSCMPPVTQYKNFFSSATNSPKNSALANERGLNPAVVIEHHKISGKEQSDENQEEVKSGREAHHDLTVQSFAKFP